MMGRTTFPVIVLLVVGTTAILMANLQRPVVDPIQAQPAATSTRWATPVLRTATASPTLTGAEGGWYSHLPTPVPVNPRMVQSETPTPTVIKTIIIMKEVRAE